MNDVPSYATDPHARMVVETYREPAIVVAPEAKTLPPCMQPVFINGGRLVRVKACAAPGWWSRLWNSIRDEDVWRCRCGKAWYYYATRGEWVRRESADEK